MVRPRRNNPPINDVYVETIVSREEFLSEVELLIREELMDKVINILLEWGKLVVSIILISLAFGFFILIAAGMRYLWMVCVASISLCFVFVILLTTWLGVKVSLDEQVGKMCECLWKPVLFEMNGETVFFCRMRDELVVTDEDSDALQLYKGLINKIYYLDYRAHVKLWDAWCEGRGVIDEEVAETILREIEDEWNSFLMDVC